MMAQDFPESEEAAHWRVVLSTVSLTFASIATITYCIRVFASRHLASKIRFEDVLMGLAVILMWGDTASALIKAFNGIGVPANQLPSYRSIRLNLGSWLVPKFWATSMACAKISIIIFLRRVLGLTKPVKVALSIVILCVLVYTGVVFFYSMFMCEPMAYYWDRTIQGSCVSNEKYMIQNIATAVAALVTDMAILIIPLPTIWNLPMRTKQKLAMTGVFGVGVIVCIFSLLRVVQFFQFDTAYLSTSSVLETLWTLLENDFSIICGCAPQMAPLFKSLRPGKVENSGYSGSYYSHGIASFYPNSEIKTTVSGQTATATSVLRTLTSSRPRSSSELELNGIEVRTAINQEVSSHSSHIYNDEEQRMPKMAPV